VIVKRADLIIIIEVCGASEGFEPFRAGRLNSKAETAEIHPRSYFLQFLVDYLKREMEVTFYFQPV